MKTPTIEKLDWSRIEAWLHEKRVAIAGFARKFLPYSPYELEDFMSQAAVAAWEAAESCSMRGEEERFEAYFWVNFREQCSDMASNPSWRDVQGDDWAKSPMDFVCVTDAAETIPSAEPDADPVRRMLETVFDDDGNRPLLGRILALLTPREAEIWELMLRADRPLTHREVGLMLGITRQSVGKSAAKGLARLRERLFEPECEDILAELAARLLPEEYLDELSGETARQVAALAYARFFQGEPGRWRFGGEVCDARLVELVQEISRETEWTCASTRQETTAPQTRHRTRPRIVTVGDMRFREHRDLIEGAEVAVRQVDMRSLIERQERLLDDENIREGTAPLTPSAATREALKASGGRQHLSLPSSTRRCFPCREVHAPEIVRHREYRDRIGGEIVRARQVDVRSLIEAHEKLAMAG